MPQKSHWPFGGNPWDSGGRNSSRGEDAKTRSTEVAAQRQRVRHDRLIVGGRAHVKKSGLS